MDTIVRPHNITRPQHITEFVYGGDKRNTMAVAYGGQSTDVLDQEDTVSLEDLYGPAYDQMARAGIDDLTPVDTFLNMNGEHRYVTDL